MLIFLIFCSRLYGFLKLSLPENASKKELIEKVLALNIFYSDALNLQYEQEYNNCGVVISCYLGYYTSGKNISRSPGAGRIV